MYGAGKDNIKCQCVHVRETKSAHARARMHKRERAVEEGKEALSLIFLEKAREMGREGERGKARGREGEKGRDKDGE